MIQYLHIMARFLPARDRRRYPRYDCSLRVNYFTDSLAGIESDTTAEDISCSGMRMNVSRLLKRGNVLKLNVTPYRGGDPVSILGQIVWTKLSLQNPRFSVDAGIRFLDKTPVELDNLVSAGNIIG